MVAMKVKRERRKDWIEREATALQALFSEAERLMQTGLNTGQALRAVRKRRYIVGRLWRHRTVSTLRRRFARWQQGGRTVEAARLGFKPGRPRVADAEVARVALRLLRTEASTVAEAWRCAGKPTSYSTFCRRVPPSWTRRFSELAKARAKVKALTTELVEELSR